MHESAFSGNKVWAKEIASWMAADLEFLVQLLQRPVYESGAPNTFERLEEFRAQAISWMQKLEEMTPGEPDARYELLGQVAAWKKGLFEFLLAKIFAGKPLPGQST